MCELLLLLQVRAHLSITCCCCTKPPLHLLLHRFPAVTATLHLVNELMNRLLCDDLSKLLVLPSNVKHTKAAMFSH